MSNITNIHLVFDIPNAYAQWKNFKSTVIAAENTASISISPGTLPFGTLRDALFKNPAYHLEPIEILDITMVDRLKKILQEKRILRDNGTLVGGVLFADNNPSMDDKNPSAIGIGVVNADTNEPEGVIFCPEGMFPYKKTGFSGGNGRKRRIVSASTQSVLKPMGIPI